MILFSVRRPCWLRAATRLSALRVMGTPARFRGSNLLTSRVRVTLDSTPPEEVVRITTSKTFNMPKAKKTRATPPARTDPIGKKSANATSKTQSTTKKPAGEVNNAKSTTEAKGDCQAGNYLLLVVLAGTQDPNIQRLISLPPDATFQKLHQALQISFGWAGCHMHQFTVRENDERHPFMGSLVLTLMAEPDHSLMDPEEGEEMKAESTVSLADVFENDSYKGRTSMIYEYDMGDSWEHEIVLVGRADAALGKRMGIEQKIVCIAGEGHGCAEDCGSIPGWEDLKAAFAKPRGDKFLREWYKDTCANGDAKGLDPWKWDILKINEGLSLVRPSLLPCSICAVTDLAKI